MSNQNKPPCAEWSIWEGPEVEGESNAPDLGARTLFVRRATADVLLPLFALYNRVWFCVEFEDWDVVYVALNKGLKVCVEVDACTWPDMPDNIKQQAKIYYKVRAELKEGDVVSAGASFSEEHWAVGSGARNVVQDYTKDRCICR
jgi:hypothetical protein